MNKPDNEAGTSKSPCESMSFTGAFLNQTKKNAMKYKLPNIEVSSESPFDNDALNRQPSAEAILSLINQLDAPFVLGIDSPWGTGKTTFVKMLKSVFEKDGFRCLYFNAWETDFSDDPLISFVGEFKNLIPSVESQDTNPTYDKVKRITSILVKRGVPLAARIATHGLLDLDSGTEKAIADLASESAENLVDAYLKEKELLQEFRSDLLDFISQKDDEQKEAIIIFVDELDRCRPTYAIELLERIKHIFNIENIIFVLSLDKSQLGISFGAVYGQGINSDEYLRRFIDLEFSLPLIQSDVFTKSLVKRFNFEEVISNEAEVDRVIEVFTALADLFKLSLRTREQCFTRMAVSFTHKKEDEDFASPIITLLTILKVGNSEWFNNYLSGSMTPLNIFEKLKELDAKHELRFSELGAYIFAIMSYASNLNRSSLSSEYSQHKHKITNKTLEEIKKSSEAEFALFFVRVYDGLKDSQRNWNLNNIRGRIELASRFN